MEGKNDNSSLRKSSSFSSLSKEEEATLLETIRLGLREGASEEEVRASDEASLALASAYLHLVETIAYDDFYYCDDDTKKDLVQEGWLTLILVAKRYNPSFGAKFSTFAYPYVRKAYQNYLKANNLLFTEEADSLPAPDSGPSPEEVEEEIKLHRLSGAITVLTPRQKEAVGYRFGAFGYPELKTFRLIGERMGISDEAARVLVHHGIAKMKRALGV